MALKRLSHRLALEHIGLIEFASETPCSREIDKDRVTLLQFGLQPLGRECLPVASELGIGRSDCRSAKFLTNEINATREHEHEHEDKHDRSFPPRCGGNDECAFHPAGDSDDQQKTAGPDGPFETALRAEHVKEKQ